MTALASKRTKCNYCSKTFTDFRSNHRKFCSRVCSYNSFKRIYNYKCQICNESFTSKVKTRKFCSFKCAGKNASNKIVNHRGNTNSGEKHHNWKGGGTINSHGYKEIPLGKANKKILEHRLVVEQSIGRKLSRLEHIHHINGDKLDNRIENLLILSPSEHSKLHMEMRYGNA